MKFLNKLIKKDREQFVVPKSVQDTIPIQAVYDDGIFKVGRDKYSKTYRFTDINFCVASDADKETMFEDYCALLNSLDSAATTKITVSNRYINRKEFEKNFLLSLSGDSLDEYREEYNRILSDTAIGANVIVQDKYITISVFKDSIEDARLYFARASAVLVSHFGRLGSKCTELSTEERLRIIHDFFRDTNENYCFPLKDKRKAGQSFKDGICPDYIEVQKDYINTGGKYARVLFMRDLASSLQDDFVSALTDISRNMMFSIDIIPVQTDEAIKEVESKLLGVETNIANWQRRQNNNNNFAAAVPYDYEQQRAGTTEMIHDLTSNNQRMFQVTITLVHTADSKEQLDRDTETFMSAASSRFCQFGILGFQQLDGLKTALPLGVRKIDIFRTVVTRSLAIIIPFKVQDIHHKHGIYYGRNVISNNLIIVDRTQLLNGNAMILGVSGGGKSFFAKFEILKMFISEDVDIMIIDPEREYGKLVNALGGEIVTISATSDSHINAMDINSEYADGANPVTLKSQFLMSLFEQLLDGKVEPKQKSIIDRCAKNVYSGYVSNGFKGNAPTLVDFYNELLRQPEPLAKDLGLALELFTNGSLDTFAKSTNVNTENRLICYDILDLGKQLSPIGMLIVLDNILNRITKNRAKGRKTYIIIDEIYLLFQYSYSAQFLFTLWKRVRKYGAYATGITQNVEDLLQIHTARTMLSNSEFIIMLNQASPDRAELAKLLNISKAQIEYIKDVDVGCGLIKVGSALVPFSSKIPKNKIYDLLNTKPHESE